MQAGFEVESSAELDIIIHSIEGKERLNLVGIKPETGLVTNKINVEVLSK